MKLNMTNTIKDSLLENYFPKGWNLDKIHECCSHSSEEVYDRQAFWNKNFQPVSCQNIENFNVMFGHEVALQIKTSRDKGEKLILILPVGPVGQYHWIVYFLKQWNVCCDHLYCFNMDEWSDSEGNTPDKCDNGTFLQSMIDNFYGPLGELTVPEEQRNFATKDNLPRYAEKIAKLRAEGARMVTVYGIGRVFHVAFWEPHFAADYSTESEWKSATHRIAAKLHPLTIEQNAIIAFASDYTKVPCYGNTVGPGILFQSDYFIGGLSATYERGVSIQSLPLWVTLRHGPTPWMTSSYMPTFPGKIFFMEQLAEINS